MHHKARMTFREILIQTRAAAAESAWRRATIASSLRRVLAARGDRRGAARLAEAKMAALRLVATLLPEQVKLTVDDDYQVGLVSIRWRGHGRFHLPADTVFETAAPPAGTL